MCPVCGGPRWTRVRFLPTGAPPVIMILSRCDGCGLRRFHPPTDVAVVRRDPAVSSSESRVHFHRQLEEFADPVAALREAGAGLGPEGAVLVTADDADSLGARWLGGAWPGWEPGRQRWVFDATTLRAAIGRAGLSVVYVRRTQIHGLLIARGEPR